MGGGGGCLGVWTQCCRPGAWFGGVDHTELHPQSAQLLMEDCVGASVQLALASHPMSLIFAPRRSSSIVRPCFPGRAPHCMTIHCKMLCETLATPWVGGGGGSQARMAARIKVWAYPRTSDDWTYQLEVAMAEAGKQRIPFLQAPIGVPLSSRRRNA